MGTVKTEGDGSLFIGNHVQQVFHLELPKEGELELLPALHLYGLRECQVFCRPVTGSILLENCQDCLFVLAAQQVRNFGDI